MMKNWLWLPLLFALSFSASANILLPECGDHSVTKVLKNAFDLQGKATRTPMKVKKIRHIKQTGFYPKKGIRSCYAEVDTKGSTYFTDYSIILTLPGFFVQVENARPQPQP